MKPYFRYLMLTCLFLFALCLVSCDKEKQQARLIITEQEFSMRQDTENTFTIDAKGKIRNVGDLDAKKVVVTAYCRSCTGLWGVGQWQASPDIERTPRQVATISYLPAGSEESFSFTEVADFLLVQGKGQTKPEMPEKLEMVIQSFETVE